MFWFQAGGDCLFGRGRAALGTWPMLWLLILCCRPRGLVRVLEDLLTLPPRTVLCGLDPTQVWGVLRGTCWIRDIWKDMLRRSMSQS